MFIAADLNLPTHWRRPRGLDELAVLHALQRDQQLCSPGTPAVHWFTVSSGIVRQCLHGADGKRHIIAFHLPGDSFGLEAGDVYEIAAEAVTNSVVIRYCQRRTTQLSRSRPEVAELLRDLLRQGLIASQARLVMLGHMNARRRLAAFLLEMSDRLAEGGSEFILPMSRYDIGDYLGLSSETVCRVFTLLVADGMISLPVPQYVKLDDRTLLEATVHPC